MKELEVNPERTEKLSWEEKILGNKLFLEGLHYEEIKEYATTVGVHLSFVLHRESQIISIHFREGLEELEKYKNKPIKMMKKFLGNIQGDLRQLALMLEEDSKLLSVKEIWGLCNLSARWGERHGFITKTWSNNLKKIAKFEQSITGKPSIDNLAINQPLYLFFHNRDSFKAEFSK